MTLEYRCSNCGTLLQTTNADPLNEQMDAMAERLAEATKLINEGSDTLVKLMAAETENGRLRAIVRVNLMRSCGATHADIDAILDPVGTGSKT